MTQTEEQRKQQRDATKGNRLAKAAQSKAASAEKHRVSRNEQSKERKKRSRATEAAAAAAEKQAANGLLLLTGGSGVAKQHGFTVDSESDHATPAKQPRTGPYTKAARSTQRKRAAAAAACVLQAPNAAAQAEVLSIMQGRGDMQEVISMAGMKSPKEQLVSNMIMGNIVDNLKLVAGTVGGQVAPHHAAYTTVLEMSMGPNIPEANMVSAASRLLGASRLALNKAVASSIDKRSMHEAGITRIDWGRCRRNVASSNSITQQQVDVIWDCWEHNSMMSPSQKDIRTYSFFDRIRCVRVSRHSLHVCSTHLQTAPHGFAGTVRAHANLHATHVVVVTGCRVRFDQVAYASTENFVLGHCWPHSCLTSWLCSYLGCSAARMLSSRTARHCAARFSCKPLASNKQCVPKTLNDVM